MPTFLYKFETKLGTQTGELEAESKEAAEAILKKQKLKIISVKAKGKEFDFGGGWPSDKDIVIFTRMFATMIGAGMPLVQCLSILGNQTTNRKFARAIIDIRTKVEGGETFADALRKHPKIFDQLYTNMIEAGEIGGILDTILLRLAAYIEKAVALKAKVKSAMVYPIAIVSVAVVVVVFLLIFVIPTFATMFEDFGGSLPWPTQVVIQSSEYAKSYIWLVLLAGGGFAFLVKTIYSKPAGQLAIDKGMLRVPVFGELVQKVAVAKFTRTMGTLISSGVPIIEGLNITAKTAGNKVIEGAVLDVIEEIKQGKGLSGPLSEQGVFPPMVVQMIEVGEETGALDKMMNKIADFYDEEVDAAVEGLTALLEPMLMVFLGITVGFVVVAMYLPIFKMASVVG